MKYRYLKITGDWIYGKSSVTKEDLAQVKQKTIDCLIDVKESKYFDAENNVWKEIEGD